MSRSSSKILLVPLVFFGLFVFLVDPSIVIAPLALGFGWMFAAGRYWVALHPSLQSVIWLGLALVCLVGGAHLFLRWLYAALRTKSENSRWPSKWRWKWTVCMSGVVGCSLVAVGCVILTTHQIYWVAKSHDSIFTDPLRQKLGLRMAATDLRASVETNRWDTKLMADAFFHSKKLRFPGPLAEYIHPIWVPSVTNVDMLRAVILMPQRPMVRSMAILIVMEPGKDDVMRPFDDLPEVLSAFGIDAGELTTATTGKAPP